MNRRPVLSDGVLAKTQVLISLCVLRVDAERGARLGNRIRTVVQTIEKICQGSVVLRKIGHDPCRLREFFVGLIPLLLPPVDHTQREVQCRILGVGSQHLTKIGFGFVEVLPPGFSCRLQQNVRNCSAHPRGLSIPGVQHPDQVLTGSRRLHLPQFISRRQGG
jgi:hypothetical protein